MEYIYLIIAYFIGTFPTGPLIARGHGIKIQEHGSKNIGATNVARVLGKQAGILTLVGDIIKGVLAVGIARIFFSPLIVSLAGLSAVCGHCFSIPGKGKGGKGVATAIGVLLALHPLSAILGIAAFIICFTVTKYVSLSSITAALIIPIYQLLTNVPNATLFPTMGISLLVVLRHHENIRRLIEGREPQFGRKGTSA